MQILVWTMKLLAKVTAHRFKIWQCQVTIWSLSAWMTQFDSLPSPQSNMGKVDFLFFVGFYIFILRFTSKWEFFKQKYFSLLANFNLKKKILFTLITTIFIDFCPNLLILLRVFFKNASLKLILDYFCNSLKKKNIWIVILFNCFVFSFFLIVFTMNKILKTCFENMKSNHFVLILFLLLSRTSSIKLESQPRAVANHRNLTAVACINHVSNFI